VVVVVVVVVMVVCMYMKCPAFRHPPPITRQAGASSNPGSEDHRTKGWTTHCGLRQVRERPPLEPPSRGQGECDVPKQTTRLPLSLRRPVPLLGENDIVLMDGYHTVLTASCLGRYGVLI
jgi:hypothetical protein